MKKLIIILLLLTTGCSRYTELNELAVIKSIGLDYQENNYTMYASIIDEIEKDNIPKNKLYTVTSPTIKDLFKDIKKIVNKQIHLSHIDLLILSNNLKDDNYIELIDYAIGHKELRNDYLTIISDDIELLLKKTKYDEIEEFITVNKANKNIININFRDITKTFLVNKQFKIPYITYKEDITFNGNYLYHNNNLERINYE